MLKYWLIVSLLFIQSSLLAADIKLTISFPKDFKVGELQMILEDGGICKMIQPVFENNTAVIAEDIKSTYASLLILYPCADKQTRGKQFMIDSSSAYIKFSTTAEENPLANYKAGHVFEFSGSAEDKELRNFTKVESAELIEASNQYAKVVNDSTLAALNRTNVNYALKCMEFIKQHGNNYWYFWYFRTEVAGTLLDLTQLELYEVFNTAFPDKFKDTYEGQNLKKLIIGNIGFHNGDLVPDFLVDDIHGNPISAKSNRGKYMIISFWATWCSPCVAEIPFLKKLRDCYSEKKLEIISISADKDSIALIKGIEKYKMNWTHVLSANTNLKLLFGNKPIPGLYLVDSEGSIRFTNWIDGDNKIIEKILEESIGGK